MKLTKYQHACFTVEEDEQLLVVDPGKFSTDFIAPEHVAAIIVTHKHGDHFDQEQITAIMDKNPDAVIIGHPEVLAPIETFTKKLVEAGEIFKVGPFRLQFFGGEHAIIHPLYAPVANLGVLVNDLLYYPGDSFTVPKASVDTLALPVAGPWMKIGEAIDFYTEISPRLAFPTHDAVLSEVGQESVDDWLGGVAKTIDSEYKRLSEPLEI